MQWYETFLMMSLRLGYIVIVKVRPLARDMELEEQIMDRVQSLSHAMADFFPIVWQGRCSIIAHRSSIVRGTMPRPLASLRPGNWQYLMGPMIILPHGT